MTEDEEVQAPPPSIDIGTLQFDADNMAKDETESMTVPEETTDTSPAVVKPDNEPVNMQPLSQDANDAYATYIKIKEAKPSDGWSYAGIAVIFAGFIFGYMTLENDVESAFTSCCLGIFLGIILIILGANDHEKWKKEKKGCSPYSLCFPIVFCSFSCFGKKRRIIFCLYTSTYCR